MKTAPPARRSIALRAIVDLKARGWTRPELCQFLNVSERTLFRREAEIGRLKASSKEPVR